MLVIAIGYGHLTDEFSCSASPGVGNTEVIANPGDDVRPYLDFICKVQRLQPEWVNEILVIDVAGGVPVVNHSFNFEDGLGDHTMDFAEPDDEDDTQFDFDQTDEADNVDS